MCAVFLTPRMVILYTWCCSCELLKNPDVVIEVVRKMRHEKLVNIIRILSMLSFFLDQVEFLISVAINNNLLLACQCHKYNLLLALILILPRPG